MPRTDASLSNSSGKAASASPIWGLEPPPEYRDYLTLGRFRNRVILDPLKQKPNAGLQRFTSAYRLEYYDPEK